MGKIMYSLVWRVHLCTWHSQICRSCKIKSPCFWKWVLIPRWEVHPPAFSHKESHFMMKISNRITWKRKLGYRNQILFWTTLEYNLLLVIRITLKTAWWKTAYISSWDWSENDSQVYLYSIILDSKTKIRTDCQVRCTCKCDFRKNNQKILFRLKCGRQWVSLSWTQSPSESTHAPPT